ncbi:MAG: CD3324 family protein [Clostridium sp.]|uniref:CD3324 family protein n=1 Tax=Clostridium sp. TaxID=1506 RepID=UPI003D6CE9C4
MKYIKANVIFPEELLKEIQKYVQGEMVYIPNSNGNRKEWGESSGNRAYLTGRNTEIREKFGEGSSIEKLCTTFCLSIDSIKKIVYCNK